MSTIHHTAANGVDISEDNIRRIRSGTSTTSDLQYPTVMARRTSSSISATSTTTTPEPIKLFDKKPKTTVQDDNDVSEEDASSDDQGGEKSSSISVYTEHTTRSFLTMEPSIEVYEDGHIEPAKKERKPKKKLTPKQQQLQRDSTTPTNNTRKELMRIIGKTTPKSIKGSYDNLDDNTSRAYSVPDTVDL